jgi:muramoyltetrapeptide carboxypeptidase
MVVPPRVMPGDTVAVVSPASDAVGRYPHRAERGRAFLERLGLQVTFMPNSARTDGWVSSRAADRVADIHAAFADPRVTVVLAGIGGNHCNQLLPLLNWELIRANPKVFQGYSDISVLHWAMARHAGLRTFYGPALIPELGEWPEPLAYTAAGLRSAWFGDGPIALASATEWTEERVDWGGEDRIAPRRRRLEQNAGWTWPRRGTASGWIFGGCLETICWHLKGSRSWLDLDGAVLFLETSEEAPSPAHVDAYLTDLEQLGVFSRAAALLVGRPAGYTPSSMSILERVLVERTAAAGIPVVSNIDCGHTDPMSTLPLGAWITVDGESRRLTCTEPATAPR